MSAAPRPGTPQEWLEHACSDVAYAKLGLTNPDVLPNQAAFHAQQAAEKARKAALIFRGISFPFTHDLTDLVRRWTGSGNPWPLELARTDTLNPYAAETRYPGRIHQVTHAEVQAAIEIAEKVVLWAQALLFPPSHASDSSRR